MRKSTAAVFAFLALVFFLAGAQAQPNSPDGLLYKTGYSAILKLGLELYRALPPKHRQIINEQPVFLETDLTPFIHAIEYTNSARPLKAVFISVGFMDLANHVAHARAIDRYERGYFNKYVARLGQENGQMSLTELPNLKNPKFWNVDVMNGQLSYFSQIVSVVVATQLAHHYLGHYEKYRSHTSDAQGRPVSLTGFLTPAEFEAALKAGVKNSLDCGYGVDGLKALFESIDKMPQRPAWTADFLPEKAKASKLKRDLERMEKDFFGANL